MSALHAHVSTPDPDAGVPDAQPPHDPPVVTSPTAEQALQIELKWLREVYQGDNVKQATARAILMGAILGGALSLQNLYVGLKTGWGLGVAITACVLSYSIYSSLVKLAPKVFGPPMTILENNAMQSTASSAGYSTGGVMTSAMAAYLIVNKHHVPPLALTLWTFFLAVLGTVMAIPMKRQMINIEQLRFPSGMAAAETLRSLHAEGDEARKKGRALGYSALFGAVITWLRDAHPVETIVNTPQRVMEWLTKLSVFPGMIEIPAKFPRNFTDLKTWLSGGSAAGYPVVKLAGAPLAKYTIAFEGSFIMVAAGALMGLRTTSSMIIAGLINYGVLAPWMASKGVITTLSYRGIVSWSLWIGAPLMVTSGLLTFALQWRTVVRAFKGLGDLFGKKGPVATGEQADAEAALAAVEVPPSWFAAGMTFSTIGIVLVGWHFFHINPFFGVLAVFLSFFLCIVACRATGETDTTPIGAMGKITQLTYGMLAPGNITTNLMTASITAGAAGSAADLLTDLKSGYLLGANPRKQFLAQLAGTVVGTAVVVPMFYVLVPTADMLGSAKFPAPSAQVWAGVAMLLSHGVENLHPTARWGMLIGGIIGIVLPLLELKFPKHKHLIPSAMGVGLAFVIPAFNSISMFLGAVLAWLWEKKNQEQAERYVVAVSSGIIAGESLMGVAVVLFGSVLQWLGQ